MKKSVGVLAMMLMGGLAFLQPSVAQARDWDDVRHFDRHEDRRDWGRGERGFDWREHEWQERREREIRERQRRFFRDRFEYRNQYGQPYYYHNNGYGDPRCPR